MVLSLNPAITNPKAVRPVPVANHCRQENPADVTCFTKAIRRLPVNTGMAQKTYPASLEPKADLTDRLRLDRDRRRCGLIAFIYLV